MGNRFWDFLDKRAAARQERDRKLAKAGLPTSRDVFDAAGRVLFGPDEQVEVIAPPPPPPPPPASGGVSVGLAAAVALLAALAIRGGK